MERRRVTCTRCLTTDSAVSNYTAFFAVKHLAATSASPDNVAGVVSVSPSTADNYYPLSSVIQVTAAAQSGYCFSGWTGLATTTPPTANVTMTKPYTLAASFIAGAISATPATATPTAAGGTLKLSVSATSGCRWEARSNVPWITLSKSGTGPAVVY